jgi:hypothetical protein
MQANGAGGGDSNITSGHVVGLHHSFEDAPTRVQATHVASAGGKTAKKSN